MRRLVGALTILALVIALSPSPVGKVMGAGSQPLTLAVPPPGQSGYGQLDQPVEQQSDWPWLPGPLDCSANVKCTINPTPCRWDVDDHWQVLAVDRYLDGGASAAMSPCIVADSGQDCHAVNGNMGCWSGPRGRIGVSLNAPSPDLVVTVTFSPQGRTFTAGRTVNGNGYLYSFCGQAVYVIDDPALVPIAGSANGTNGFDGLGVVTTVTVSVSNPTNKRVRGINAEVQLVGVGAAGASCLANSSEAHTDYPFRWSP